MHPLTIRSITTRVVDVPLRRPLATKIGSFATTPFLLIDLLTEEGVTGRSYLFGYRPNGARLQAAVLEEIEVMVKGRPCTPATLYDDLVRGLNLYGPQGIAFNAISGFDMAAWDACARAAGLPLAAFLGGTPGPVRAYNSNGLGLLAPDAVAAQAVELLDGGFRAMKIRFGRDHVDEDVAAFEAVRGAIPDDCLLMSDFNQGLSRREGASAPAPARRPGPGLVRGTDRLRGPGRLSRTPGNRRDPDPDRGELLRPRGPPGRGGRGRGGFRDAGRGAHRRRDRMDARGGHRP